MCEFRVAMFHFTFFLVAGDSWVGTSSHEKLRDALLGGWVFDGGRGQQQEAVEEAGGRENARGTSQVAVPPALHRTAQTQGAPRQEEEPQSHQGWRAGNTIKFLCFDNMKAGLEIKLLFFREPNCIFSSYLEMLCIETCTSLGSLQKFEGATREFKRALGSRHPLISSPGRVTPIPDHFFLFFLNLSCI